MLAAGHTTHPDARRCLETLCETYREPLYAFLRRKGEGLEDASDTAQGFFAAFLAGNYLKTLRAERGRFRCYLLGAWTRFPIDERDHARALKRGGGSVHLLLDSEVVGLRYLVEPVDRLTRNGSMRSDGR